MALLLETRQGALLATAATGLFFFLLEWALSLSAVWKVLSGHWLRREKNESQDVEEAFRSGLRFRIVCAVHNTPQSVLAVWALLDHALWEDTLEGQTALAQCVVIATCGFFVWDITFALRKMKADGMVPVLHGFLTFASLFYVVLTNNCHFYGVASIIWEMSTPFVHVRWILYKLGMKGTRIYFYNGLSMLASFGVCRIVWGTCAFILLTVWLTRFLSVVIAAKFFTLSGSEVAARIGAPALWMLRGLCLSGNLLNYYWFWKMLVLSRKAVIAMRSKGDEPLKDV